MRRLSVLFRPRNGRPRKIPTPEEFDRRVDAYVREMYRLHQPVTWTGMAMAIGFTSRTAMNSYEENEGFSDSVKRAKMFVEHEYEKRLHGHNASGAMFALGNLGWENKRYMHNRIEGFLDSSQVRIDWSKVDDRTLRSLMDVVQSLPKDAFIPADAAGNVVPFRRPG